MKFLWALLLSSAALCQPVALSFQPVIGGKECEISDTAAKGETHISLLKFYVSNLQLYADGKPVYDCGGRVFLIDASDKKSLTPVLDVPEDVTFDELRFTIGIDGKTNGAGPGEGALDPVHGMYWSWQSGYINFKVEGSRGGKAFMFHLGGFQKPFGAWRTVKLPVSSRNIRIKTDVSKFLDAIPADQTTLMSPGEKAMALSDLAAKIFSL